MARVLGELVLGDTFDQPTLDAVWPTYLVELVLGDRFNHPIKDVSWPMTL